LAWQDLGRLTAVHVLLVEDNPHISKLVSRGLSEQGFYVDEISVAAGVLDRLRQAHYGCLILDLMLPDGDGLTILRDLRGAGLDVPVILLTARNELEDRVVGLELGADDYIGKPFFVEELAARIKAVSRRKAGVRTTDQLCAGNLVLDRLKRQIATQSHAVALTTREFNLLECLMQIPERVFTRTHLLQRVWGFDFDPATNVVDVCIQRIRRKMATIGATPHIANIRGVGYSFQNANGESSRQTMTRV
jgi:two-component system, OmpR family, response regulator